MNTLELSNVEISEKTSKSIKDSGRELKVVDALIDPVIQRLAVLNPLWRFVVDELAYLSGDNLKATGFKVIEAGEVLGTIERHYHGREYVIHVCNERIGKERVRRGGYKTKDADKAILKAKKMFFKLKPTERIEQATKAAMEVINTQKRRKDNENYNHLRVVQDAAHKFIMGTGLSLFLEHVETWHEIDKNRINKARAEHGRLSEEMLTIDKVKSQFEAGKTALVIKDDGKYLVKVGDAIQLYDDNTLPDDMRGKLGMLKLVEAEAFISNTGCRINDEVFVLVVEES